MLRERRGVVVVVEPAEDLTERTGAAGFGGASEGAGPDAMVGFNDVRGIKITRVELAADRREEVADEEGVGVWALGCKLRGKDAPERGRAVVGRGVASCLRSASYLRAARRLVKDLRRR